MSTSSNVTVHVEDDPRAFIITDETIGKWVSLRLGGGVTLLLPAGDDRTAALEAARSWLTNALDQIDWLANEEAES